MVTALCFITAEPNRVADVGAEIARIPQVRVVYSVTGSWAAAAVVATVFASVGYYATAYVNAVRWSLGDHGFGRANLLALRSVTVEFGPAEVVDSLAIRPVALFLGPVLIGNGLLGLIIGKLVADAGFYGCTVVSYERFRTLLAVQGTDRTEAPDESLAAIADR